MAGTGARTAPWRGVIRLGCLSSPWQSPGSAPERSGDRPASLPACHPAVRGSRRPRVFRGLYTSDPQVRDGPAVQPGDGKCHRITAGLLREA
jgi:hypothetical protein